MLFLVFYWSITSPIFTLRKLYVLKLFSLRTTRNLFCVESNPPCSKFRQMHRVINIKFRAKLFPLLYHHSYLIMGINLHITGIYTGYFECHSELHVNKQQFIPSYTHACATFPAPTEPLLNWNMKLGQLFLYQ